jgi:hypothetical protein
LTTVHDLCDGCKKILTVYATSKEASRRRGLIVDQRTGSEVKMTNQFSLANRKAVVAGGDRGVGAGITEAVAKAGSDVVIGEILDDLGRETETLCLVSTGLRSLCHGAAPATPSGSRMIH